MEELSRNFTAYILPTLLRNLRDIAALSKGITSNCELSMGTVERWIGVVVELVTYRLKRRDVDHLTIADRWAA